MIRAASAPARDSQVAQHRLEGASLTVPIDTLLQDLRYGARALRLSPGFTAIAALTLALGIGANTAVFSVVDGVLLRPLPYAAPERLVSVTGTYPNGAFSAMREELKTMDVAAYADGDSFNITGLGEAVRVPGTLVSAELFSILRVRPRLGRTFPPGADRAGRDHYAILSHRLWQERFGGDPTIVGRSVEVQGVPREILGVMPEDFRFPSARTQLWVPLHYDPADAGSSWGGHYMPVVGRLRPGASLAQAHAELRLFQSRVGERFPWKMPATWNADVSVVPLRQGMVADARARLIMLLGAVALVLLVACANVANLTLARAVAREREMGLRAALGAGPGRVARQLLTESVLLACLGSALGLLLATQGVPLLKALLPPETPRLAEVEMNWRVLAFSGVLAMATGCLFGLFPVIHASRAHLARILSGARGAATTVSEGLRGALAVAQIALAVLLVIAAGLFIRSLWSLSSVNPGFRAEQILTARISPNASVCGEVSRCLAFYDRFESEVRSMPGVGIAALASTLPLGGTVAKRSLELEDVETSGDIDPLFWLNAVTADYFRVMEIPVHSGRAFTAADFGGGPPVAVMAEAAAGRFWPGESALGKQIRFVDEPRWRTIVGVVANVRGHDLTRDVPDWTNGMIYIPYTPAATQEDGRVPAEMALVVRTGMDASRFGAELRSVATSLSRQVAISDVRPMGGYVSDAVAAPASTTALFLVFAGLALVLGSIGVYGVVAFLVTRRTREIGLRMALGAGAANIAWLVLREGAKVSLIGTVCGMAGALALSRLLASELHGVSPADPVTYAGVAVIIVGVTFLACYVPMRRATAVDPIGALRDP